MSIILKGLDLPKDILDIEIEFRYINVGATYVSHEIIKAKDIIELPSPHGRLIDGDKLVEDMKRNNPQTSKIKWVQILAECAPTILEAEE